MPDPSLQQQLVDALFTVRSLRRALVRQGALAHQVEDLAQVDALLERLATEHTAYWELMGGLEGTGDQANMAEAFFSFCTHLRQDYRKHAKPDPETYDRFCKVLGELYDAAKRTRSIHRGL